ncbi:MAG TPA: zf-HC2 domain-containing protein, partial [Acidimicrobiales bacterium]
NGAAQLAVRARAGLRERFLQAHLQGPVEEQCRFTVERLGAYVGGGLAAREIAKVDQHLASCDACRARQAELEDLGGSLRRALIPLPLGLAAFALNRWKLASSIASVADRPATGVARVLGRIERPLLATSLGMASLGIVAAAVVGQRVPTSPAGGQLAAPPGGGAAAPAPISSPPVVTFTDAVATVPAPAAPAAVATSGVAPAATQAAAASAVATAPAPLPAPPGPPVTGSGGGTTDPTDPPPGGGTTNPTNPPSPPPPLASAGAALVAGPLQTTAAVTADPSCTGTSTTGATAGSASVGGQTVGCSAPAPAPSSTTGAASATVTTGGSLTGTQTVQVP